MATVSQNTPSDDKGVSTESGAANPPQVDAKKLGGIMAKAVSWCKKVQRRIWPFLKILQYRDNKEGIWFRITRVYVFGIPVIVKIRHLAY